METIFIVAGTGIITLFIIAVLIKQNHDKMQEFKAKVNHKVHRPVQRHRQHHA